MVSACEVRWRSPTSGATTGRVSTELSRRGTTENAMSKAIDELAHFVAGTPWETIPEALREHAKLVLLDTVGVILAGSVQPEVAGVRARLTATGGRGATVYAPDWAQTDRRADEPRAQDRCDPRPHTRLHQRRGGGHRAERGRRDERLRRGSGAGAGAGRRRRTAERDRGGLRPAGRRRVPA